MLGNKGMTFHDNDITFDKAIKVSDVQADKISALSSPDDSFINLGIDYINIENRRSAGFVRIAAWEAAPYVNTAKDWPGDTEFSKYVYASHEGGEDWTPGFGVCTHDYSPNPNNSGHGACPLPGYQCTEDGGHCRIPS